MREHFFGCACRACDRRDPDRRRLRVAHERLCQQVARDMRAVAPTATPPDAHVSHPTIARALRESEWEFWRWVLGE